MSELLAPVDRVGTFVTTEEDWGGGELRFVGDSTGRTLWAVPNWDLPDETTDALWESAARTPQRRWRVVGESDGETIFIASATPVVDLEAP
jgi:hypothetical protein